MICLVDTNVLARAAQPGHAQHSIAVDSVATLRLRGEDLRVAAQNLYEFWVIATRPTDRNGLGLSVEAARDELSRLIRLYDPLEERPAVFTEWVRIISTTEVSGKTSHDARLVAAMTVHGVKAILTFNAADFARYPGVTVLIPQQVLERP